MKKIFFISITLALFVGSCRKGPTAPPGPTFSKGTPMPKGIPIGDAITKTIGPLGGTISSADSEIIVTIPAGAVSTNTEFSIQPITNTAPNAIGNSYLLMPEGKHFEKPVSIQFEYTDDQIEGTVAGQLLIAYQDTAGIWNAAGGSQLDTIKKTITVTSAHFSRWSVFANTLLFVDKPSIDQKEIANLAVFDVIKKKSLEDNEMLAALHQPGMYVPLDGSTPTTHDVSNWLAKDGTIQSTNATTAKYTAPDYDPTPNPVTISVEVSDLVSPLVGPTSKTLKRKIYVSSSYLEIVLDGNTNIYPNATAAFSNGSLHIQSFNQASNGGLLNPILSGTGSFTWGNDGGGKDIFLWVGGIPFGDYYSVCEPSPHSETTIGVINITKWADKVGDFVEGDFEGEVVHNNADRSCTNVKKNVSGRFRAKRTI